MRFFDFKKFGLHLYSQLLERLYGKSVDKNQKREIN